MTDTKGVSCRRRNQTQTDTPPIRAEEINLRQPSSFRQASEMIWFVRGYKVILQCIYALKANMSLFSVFNAAPFLVFPSLWLLLFIFVPYSSTSVNTTLVKCRLRVCLSFRFITQLQHSKVSKTSQSSKNTFQLSYFQQSICSKTRSLNWDLPYSIYSGKVCRAFYKGTPFIHQLLLSL